MRSTPMSTASLANGMLQLRVNTSVRSPPHVVPSKFSIGSVGLRRDPRVLVGERGGEVGHAGLQGDARRQHLERRARHVALLVGVGEQRVAGRRVEEREDVGRRVEVGVDDQVRVVGREAPHRLHRAGRRLEHDHRALALAEGVLGGLLQVGAHGRDAPCPSCRGRRRGCRGSRAAAARASCPRARRSACVRDRSSRSANV